MCLGGAEVASWSLTQEVAGSSPFTVLINIFSLNLLNSVKTFRENSNSLAAIGNITVLDKHLTYFQITP